MFRISSLVRELVEPTPLGPQRRPAGPVVIWNLIRRCNLTCRHCYSISADTAFAGELSTAEAMGVLDQLKAARVPALILSGGEPLLRPDLFEIAARAKALGFYLGLSTNGTLLTPGLVDQVEAAQFDYVGISLDGTEATHDRFRRLEGAHARALAGLRLCRDRQLKVGLRFTLTRDNAAELPALLQLVEVEGIDRFYLSHLNYAGRGNKNRRDDAQHRMTRDAMELLFETALGYAQRGITKDFTTGNNDADGPFFLAWVQARFPRSAAHIEARLRQWGGNSSGQNIANIDNLGIVHPDTMWWHHPLGSVRERSFGEIWQDTRDPLMAGLRQHPRPVKGRCARCAHLAICNGNTRVRALQLTGDPWDEDPGCYLDNREIGLGNGETSAGTPSTSGSRAGHPCFTLAQVE
ncbi:MAG: heme d1 biosynthesis radical SAM protein NirJ [Rhodocyclales bacterium]|nr:heme d1 biosynthesis radical SAM protein NirJ [Rhodocyclales bacterium]